MPVTHLVSESLSGGYGERMELRQLRYFVAVAEELHFGRAAKRLHISTPGLSQQIRLLERHVGSALLLRDHRHVSLTAAGELLLQHSRRLLAQADLAVTEMRALAGRALELRFGLLGGPGVGVAEACIQLLDEFTRLHPAAKIRYEQLNLLDQHEALLHGRVDAVFTPAFTAVPELQADAIDDEPLVLAVSARHPLAEAESIDLATALDQAYIDVPYLAPPGWRDQFLAINLRGHGHQPHERGRTVATLADGLAEIAVYDRVSLAPASSRQTLRWPGVRYVTINDGPSTVHQLLTRRRNDNPAVAALRHIAGTYPQRPMTEQ